MSRSRSHRFHFLLLILFAGSGFSALIYEVVWYQLLQLVIGSTAVSLGILLATYMGGLCIGSLALPRIAAVRRHHPLRIYAALELGIGLCGVLVLAAMPLVDHVYAAWVGHGFPAILLRGIMCSLCLLPPTILMGASLPALARWIETTPAGISWLGLLYGWNTAGAVVGCMVAGFYLLRIFNMTSATYVAASVNAAGALACWALAKRAPAPSAPQEIPAERPRSSVSRHWPVFIAIALSGVCALGAEVIWTRLMGLLLGATVYTFSIILAVFLTGLALGGAAGAVLSPSVRPQTALGCCQLLVTLSIAWPASLMLKVLPPWPFQAHSYDSLLRLFSLDLLRVAWAILPATLFWGASFSFALASAAPGDERADDLVGAIYAANTAGAIVGALAFSLLLIPHWGTHQAERVLIALALVSAVITLFSAAWASEARVGLGWLGAGIVVTCVIIARLAPVPPQLIAFGRYMGTSFYGSNVLYVGEGINSSIAISENSEGEFLFHVSGKVEASTEPADMKLQRMLGHLPALIHANPRSALIVGFGAGVTAGSFVKYNSMQRMVICEIEPMIPPVATKYFGNENYQVLHDPRTTVIYDDARHYILTTPEQFDIITSDPIHPWVKGSATLYSKEYFELVKDHLNPGGIVTQWVPLYETDLQTVKSELATFFAVFPNGTIWANELADQQGYDVVLLGQNEPTTININELQARLDSSQFAGVAQSLRDVGIHTASDLLSTYAGQAQDLKPWLADAQINLDRNLRLQYLAGWALRADAQTAIYDDLLRQRVFPENLFAGPPEGVAELRNRILEMNQSFRLKDEGLAN